MGLSHEIDWISLWIQMQKHVWHNFCDIVVTDSLGYEMPILSAK